MSTLVATALAPLDWLRALVLRAVAGVPFLRPLVATRDVRTVVQATFGVSVALLATAAAPVLLFALGPLVLGVPHVASDVRYLMLRPALPRAWLLLGVGLIGIMVAGRVVEAWIAPGMPATQLEGTLGFAWIIAAVVWGTRIGRQTRPLFYLVPLLVLAGAALALRPGAVMVAFPYLHNGVALGLWLLLFRGSARTLALIPCAAVGAGTLLLLSGAIAAPATASFAGVSLADAAAVVAPGLPAEWSLRFAMVFVFTQSVHYAVWIGWIPQEHLRTEGSLTWRQTARSLGRDFTRLGVVALLLSLVLLWIAATSDVYGTRSLYLSIANFHGLLELATLAFVVTSGLSLRRAA